MMAKDFQRREFADGEMLAQGLADWTAERLREGVAVYADLSVGEARVGVA